MISPREIEDKALLVAYGAFLVGSKLGSFVCASVEPALRYEVDVRVKGVPRSDAPPVIEIDPGGLDAQDIKEATIRCLALRRTCQQFKFSRCEQFASEILELIQNQGGPTGNA